ncbi:MAG: heme biosynthesis HemY N-terminal domain-containing protein [Pseudomonadota bacterium]|nr:heme biosynthesis HemY N-terminal domain-containing protein [Pseudomonadota bacterium]
MFARLFGLVILVLLAALLASWLGAQPGMLAFEWLGWQVEMRTSLAVALLVVLALLLLFVDRLFRGLLGLPAWFGRNLARRRTESGHRALALGLMAVSAGEPDEARRQASRAQRLLAAPQLTDLLSAQAAHLSGDHQAADRYFTSLTRDKDTAFLGHVGLARLALEKDDPDAALAAARTALDIRPKSALAARQVMTLEAERGNWAAALPALSVVMAAGDVDDETGILLSRQKAALSYLEALDDSAESDISLRRRARIGSAQDALAVMPGFWPAALLLADLHEQAGSPKKAVKPLETAFRNMPHESLAMQLQTLWGVKEGTAAGRLMRLIPDDGALAAEGRRVVAAVALEHGLFGEARRLIDEIDPALRDAAVWRLVARLAAEGEAPDSAAENDALREAGEAPRPRRWQCTSCQLVHEAWQPHCGGCAGFVTLEWRRPDGITPLISSADETD